MPDINPFSPQQAGKVISTDNNSDRVALAGSDNRIVRVANAGTVKGFIEFGDSTVTAVIDTSTVILPGATEVFAVGGQVTYVAAISDDATTIDVHIMEGHGV